MTGELNLWDAVHELDLRVTRGNKVSCPKGEDTEPSLHLYEDSFYCFHCGANGDGYGLIALFTNRPVGEVLRERKGSRTEPTRFATKQMRPGDVERSVVAQYRALNSWWFGEIHRIFSRSPMWLVEREIDLWSQVFDDLSDQIRNRLHEDGSELSPFEREKLIRDMRRQLEDQIPKLQAEANRHRLVL